MGRGADSPLSLFCRRETRKPNYSTRGWNGPTASGRPCPFDGKSKTGGTSDDAEKVSQEPLVVVQVRRPASDPVRGSSYTVVSFGTDPPGGLQR